MTDLLEQAVSAARSLHPDRQDDIARVVLALAGDDPIIELTAEEEADLLDALAEMNCGELATEAEVKTVFAKYRA